MRRMSKSDIAAAIEIGMRVLAESTGSGKYETVESVFGLSKTEQVKYAGEVRRQLLSADYQDTGWNHEQPACFGNLIRFALVRKSRNGIKIEASAHIWRRILIDCHAWPLDVSRFRQCLSEYLSRFESEKSARTKHKHSNQSYNNLLSVIRSIWSVGVSIDLAETNPVCTERFPKKRTTPRKRTLSDREVSDIGLALRKRHEGLYWAYLFCLKNPIGYGDVRRLRCSDVDLRERSVSYSRKKTSQAACPVIYDELVEYCRARIGSGEDLLFDLPHDYRFSWTRALAEANVTDLTWHDLRHHSATWLVRQGVPLHIVAAIGGWSTTAMVERYHDLRAEAASAFARGRLIAGEWDTPNIPTEADPDQLELQL